MCFYYCQAKGLRESTITDILCSDGEGGYRYLMNGKEILIKTSSE